VRAFLDGGRWTLLKEYTEVESGRDNERPQLAKALHMAKVTGACLVIAKLDRLSRNAAFLLALRDSGVKFVCADVPEANDLTIGVLALVAQHERQRISARTKAALAEAKKRGTKLGNPHGARALYRPGVNRRARAAARVALSEKAERFAVDLKPIIEEIEEAGITSNRGIAQELTRREIRTPRGGITWTDTGVSRVRERLAQ